MHTSIYFMTLGVVVTGCASGPGQTKRELAGSIKVVFTNASPQPMCELQMTLEQNAQFGDNWLPAGGVPSGGSIEFKVKPGKYKATWSTCKAPNQPLLAATLIGASSITLNAQSQLFAYVPDTVPPTKRAATLGRDFKLVRFVGQAIEPVAEPAKPEKVDAFDAAEAELATGAGRSDEVKPSKPGDSTAEAKGANTTKGGVKAPEPKGAAATKGDVKDADAKGGAVVKSDAKAPGPSAKVAPSAAAKSSAKGTAKSDGMAPTATAKLDAKSSAKGTAKSEGVAPTAAAKVDANSSAQKPVAKPADPKPGAAK